MRASRRRFDRDDQRSELWRSPALRRRAPARAHVWAGVASIALLVSAFGCAPDDESSSQRSGGQDQIDATGELDDATVATAEGVPGSSELEISEGALDGTVVLDGATTGLPSDVPLPSGLRVTAEAGSYPSMSLSGTVDRPLATVLAETESAVAASPFVEQRRTGSIEKGRVTLFLANPSQHRVAIALAADGSGVKVSVTTTPPLVLPAE